MSLLILINDLIKRFLGEKGISPRDTADRFLYFSVKETRIRKNPFEAGNDSRVHDCLD